MREIKFRAWDKKEKKIIVKGLLLTLEQGLRTFDFPDFHVDFADGDRYILMQYTGLKDKDGKEIYEGDVLSAYERPLPIAWGNDSWIIGYYFESLHDFLYSGDPKEIIGNVYENPELLKGK